LVLDSFGLFLWIYGGFDLILGRRGEKTHPEGFQAFEEEGQETEGCSRGPACQREEEKEGKEGRKEEGRGGTQKGYKSAMGSVWR
jgi:hypothetical protein